MSILVGKPAPDFCVPAVLGDGKIVDKFQFSEVTQGKYALVFFYPLDFTFVCPSELIALNNRLEELKKRHVEVVAVSIDSQFTHNAWRNTPVSKGGIGHVGYTIAADINHTICRDYGVEHPAGVAFRASFMIDRQGVVQAQHVNNLPIGREIKEIIRVFDALQHHEEHGEVCPAGWQKGHKGMHATPEGVAKYLEENAEGL